MRHGETVENVEGIMQGQLPGRLSELGKKQAKLVGERLKEEKIDVIISSDLQRAVDTAEEIAKYHLGIEIDLAPGFREWNRGDYEGKKPEDVPPEFMGVDLNKNPDFAFPGGESIKDTYHRVEKTFKKVLERHMGKTVLIMGHGVVLRAIMRIIKNIGVEGEFDLPNMPNTSVSIYNIKKDGNHEEELLCCGEHLKCAG